MLISRSEIVGLILSYAFVGILFILSKYFSVLGLKREYNRKFLHIAVSHWWLIAIVYFNRVSIAIIPPLTFIISNIIARDYKLLDAMERKPNHNQGLIYYPLAMTLLIIFSFGIIHEPYIGSLGLFTLAYGDGLAAVVGTTWGRHVIYLNKTLEGTIAMFVSSFIVILIILTINNHSFVLLPTLCISTIATLLEVFSPSGYDNLLIPLFTSLLYYFVFY